MRKKYIIYINKYFKFSIFFFWSQMISQENPVVTASKTIYKEWAAERSKRKGVNYCFIKRKGKV